MSPSSITYFVFMAVTFLTFIQVNCQQCNKMGFLLIKEGKL
ncbi:hypothetical protein [Neobacillus massiliamazoniensis]|uniref:Uncharacterized protein n=1 Tax=Neobacillus massiliamazoniensis TaxID=1499688 RepID=A0A0U1NXT0_9BACI|nr:hypothetical protein [Neobacillus massiliamazoniensis]CRK82756.1 hypothetical protein BN000_02702 [Neobacillus massiliamazoniensis]